MKITVLASGSKGNCTLIETDNSKTLIDVGLTNLTLEKKLITLDINPDSINNVFITHDHVDHIAGLKVFVKKHNPTVFMTKKIYEELRKTIDFNKYVIIEDEIFVDDLMVKTFKTSHDATDSVGYIFSSCGKEFVYVTDTGYINNKYFDLLKNKDAYVFESNHDVEMLMENPNYPYPTKQRILSDKGHLSNKDSSYYLSKLIGEKTKYVILAHLSEQNNTKELAYNTLNEKINHKVDIKIATQDEITDVIEV